MAQQIILYTPFALPGEPNPQNLHYSSKIFETFTLPSIRNQTNRAFTWLLHFSPETSWAIASRYENCANIVIVDQSPDSWIRKNCKSGWLLSTWIENGDYVHAGFVEYLENHRRKKNEALILAHECYHLNRHLVEPARYFSPGVSFRTVSEDWDGRSSPLTCASPATGHLPKRQLSRCIGTRMIR